MPPHSICRVRTSAFAFPSCVRDCYELTEAGRDGHIDDDRQRHTGGGAGYGGVLREAAAETQLRARCARGGATPIYVCHICVPFMCAICVPYMCAIYACQSCSGGGKKVSPCRVIARSACPQRCVHRAPAKAMSPTEACHQQRHVTNRGMSPTEVCHQQRHVTNRGMSPTEACHQQRYGARARVHEGSERPSSGLCLFIVDVRLFIVGSWLPILGASW